MTTKNRNRRQGLSPGLGRLFSYPLHWLSRHWTLSLAEHFKGKTVRSRLQQLLFPPAHTYAELPACSSPSWSLEDTASQLVASTSCLQLGSLLRPLGGPGCWPQCWPCHLCLLLLLAPIIPGSCISLRSLDSGLKRPWKDKAYFQQWTVEWL